MSGCRGEVKDENGNGVIKPFWEMTEADQKACLEATEWCAADNGYFRGGGFSSRYLTRAEMPATMIRLNLVKGLGPVLQICEGYTINLPDEISDKIWKRTDYTWPCTWFAPRVTGEGAFKTAYDVMNNWGANHGADQLWSHRCGSDHTGIYLKNPGMHAQCTGGGYLPSVCMERIWHGQRGSGLSCLRSIWPSLQIIHVRCRKEYIGMYSPKAVHYVKTLRKE